MRIDLSHIIVVDELGNVISNTAYDVEVEIPTRKYIHFTCPCGDEVTRTYKWFKTYQQYICHICKNKATRLKKTILAPKVKLPKDIKRVVRRKIKKQKEIKKNGICFVCLKSPIYKSDFKILKPNFCTNHTYSSYEEYNAQRHVQEM